MEDILTFATILVPIVTALVQLVKTTINMKKRFVPLTGLIIGILIGFAAQPITDLELVLRLWAGGVAGLSATGLFELVFNKHTGTTKNK